MARKKEARTNLIVGIFVAMCFALGALSLFIIGQREGTWRAKTDIHTDFKTITGLRDGSPVQLAGVEIGSVSAVDFVDVTYQCDAPSEDIGRYGQGRTDNCDPYLFCGPQGLCAELEPWASKELHPPCVGSEDCGDREICVTKQFRRRYPRVEWAGWDGVCAQFMTEHKRVRVSMEIFSDKLPLIRADSRATVASNSVLGDQLVNITQGRREPIPAGGRIQATPSIYEDIEMFRKRIEAMTGKVDTSLSGISNLFSELNDERVISNIKSMIANLNEVTRQVAEGDGLVGALFNDDGYKRDFGVTLRHVRNTAGGIEQFVGRANGTLAKADENLQPLIDDARTTMDHLRGVVTDLRDPKNKSVASRLLYDEQGEMADELQKTLEHLNSVVGKIDSGQGSLGKLVNQTKPHDDLVRFMDGLNRNKTLKRLVRFVIGADEKMDAAAPE